MTQSIESMIEVLQAYKDRKKIKFLNIVGVRETLQNPSWDFRAYEYRVAPDQKKKVKLGAWILPSGMLVWYDMSNVKTWLNDCIRVILENRNDPKH